MVADAQRSWFRTGIAIVMVMLLVSTLGWLQGRFNTSDHKKALDLVKRYQAHPKGPRIPEALAARHPGRDADDVRWHSEILSSCLGHLRVTGRIQTQTTPPAYASYAFDVDLTGPSIHPTDPETVAILKAMETATASAATAEAAAKPAQPAPDTPHGD